MRLQIPFPSCGRAGAKVVVSLGRFAERTVRQMFSVRGEVTVHGPVEVGGRKRWFAFLPHPSAWKTAVGVSLEGNLSPQKLAQLRDCLK